MIEGEAGDCDEDTGSAGEVERGEVRLENRSARKAARVLAPLVPESRTGMESLCVSVCVRVTRSEFVER